jgi:hypothetical protein
MSIKQPSRVGFVVEYKDGKRRHISINRYALLSGDHLARIVAREKQRDGTLPQGDIATIKRAPENLGRLNSR